MLRLSRLLLELVVAEESTIEKATRKGQISRFLYFGGLYYYSCLSAGVEKACSYTNIYKPSILHYNFFCTKNCVVLDFKYFVLSIKKHSASWALLPIWRKVDIYLKILKY